MRHKKRRTLPLFSPLFRNCPGMHNPEVHVPLYDLHLKIQPQTVGYSLIKGKKRYVQIKSSIYCETKATQKSKPSHQNLISQGPLTLHAAVLLHSLTLILCKNTFPPHNTLVFRAINNRILHLLFPRQRCSSAQGKSLLSVVNWNGEYSTSHTFHEEYNASKLRCQLEHLVLTLL